MLPYFDVSHLPSSASFYSTVLQPLGLHYISTNTLTAPPDAPAGDSQTAIAITTTAITFGTSSPPAPVFQIREARISSEPLKLSRVVFSAPSPTAVTDFHSCALRANPALLLSSAPVGQRSGHLHRATVKDLDGNTMEVVYQPPPNYPPSYTGSTIRRTQSTQDEVTRILDWNYDVAASDSSRSALAMAAPPPTGHFPGNEPYTVLRRSVTTSVFETSPSANKDSADASESNSGGLQTGTLLGGLLGAAVGVAAGAALTYGMLKKDRDQAPRQEYDDAGTAPPFQRRATFPNNQYSDEQPAPGRYVEVERTHEKIRYPEAYPALTESRASPQKYSQAGTRRDLDDDDTRSRHTSRYHLERGTVVSAARSQAAVPRAAPLMLTDYEHQSSVGSRHSVAGKSAVPRSVVDPEAYETGTYVSARSGRTQTTVRPPPPTAETELAVRSIVSRAPSRVPTKVPTIVPSRAPTQAPSIVPSRAPTQAPSVVPSRAPTQAPTVVPSRAPSHAPSRAPTVARSHAPTAAPSRAPTKAPSEAPTYVPSRAPTKAPTRAPTIVKVPNPPPAPPAPPPLPIYGYPPATRAPTFAPTFKSAYVPAPHQVATPRSGAGSSHASWVDDDAASVAPSESISCIGTRPGRRASRH